MKLNASPQTVDLESLGAKVIVLDIDDTVEYSVPVCKGTVYQSQEYKANGITPDNDTVERYGDTLGHAMMDLEVGDILQATVDNDIYIDKGRPTTVPAGAIGRVLAISEMYWPHLDGMLEWIEYSINEYNTIGWGDLAKMRQRVVVAWYYDNGSADLELARVTKEYDWKDLGKFAKYSND